MTTLDELIERVERASGPDRVIDFHLATLTNKQMADDLLIADNITYSSDCEFVLTFTAANAALGRGYYGNHMIPEYTASLDAAVALCERVLPGYFWGVNSNKYEIGNRIAWVAEIYTSEPAIEARAHSEALALVAAVLRTKKMMEMKP